MTRLGRFADAGPMTVGRRIPGAGVRKPSREETAGGQARWGVRRYGDFVAGGLCRMLVERVLRTRSRRLASLIGRSRWAGPGLSGDVDATVAQVAVTASDLVASREPAQLTRRFVMLPPIAAIMRCR